MPMLYPSVPTLLKNVNSRYLLVNVIAARAREIAERADCRFSNQAGIYDIFMFHSDVTDIGNSLASLRRYAQTGDASEFLAASARIKRTFISLSKALSPKLENIF